MLSRERSPMSRRSILASLSAAPGVLAAATLPPIALARPADAAGADAALIAQAAALVRLSRLSDRAHARAGRKSDAVMIAMRPRPVAPQAWGGTCSIEDLPVDPASDAERRFVTTMHRPSPEHIEAQRRHAEAMEARKAEAERRHAAMGTAGAERLAEALSDKVMDVSNELEAMRATTPAGMAAKTSAFLVLAESGRGEDWMRDLVRSLAADALAMGGRADA